MATPRAIGFVVTASVWNAVLSRLTDDGVTFSGNVNGGSIAGTTGNFSSTLAVTGAVTLSSTLAVTGATQLTGNVGIGAAATAQTRLSIPIGGATPDAAGYGPALQITGPATNFGQMIGLIREGVRVWTIGYAYNTSILAIGIGQATDSNFTAAAAALTLTTAGEVQAPLQPGFLAYNSANDTSVANNSTIDFDTEVYDEGADFSGDTFTAPVTGRYLLSACVLLENTSGGAIVMQAVIVPSNHANGIQIGYRENVANGEQIAFSGSCPVDMDAGDTAVIKYFGGGTCTVSGDASQRYTWFGGRLLP